MRQSPFSASPLRRGIRLLGFSASPGNSASRLLGFSASPGNSASRLLGFAREFGFSASRLLGFPPHSAGPLYHRPEILMLHCLHVHAYSHCLIGNVTIPCKNSSQLTITEKPDQVTLPLSRMLVFKNMFLF